MPKIGGLYTGLRYDASLLSNPTQVQNADTKLQDIINDYNQENVAAVFMMPATFLRTGNNTEITLREKTIARPTTLDGYIPKNKKLFTYPYCFLLVDSLDDAHIYRYEYDEAVSGAGETITFNVECAMSCNPEIICAPISYNGVTGTNVTEAVIMKNFPQCAYSTDSYKAWLAQNANANMLNQLAGWGSTITSTIGGGIAGGKIGAMSGNPLIAAGGALVGGVLAGVTSGASVLKSENNAQVASHMGYKPHGSQGNSTFVGAHTKNFYFKRMCVNNTYAKIIDDYFTRYGYAVHSIKKPNIRVRKQWTYTQTENANITGNIPTADMVKIKSIFNRGVTFWNEITNIGLYNLDNGVPDRKEGA